MSGVIQQILQPDWILGRVEFSHLDRHSGRNPWSWSIFVNGLAVILCPSLYNVYLKWVNFSRVYLSDRCCNCENLCSGIRILNEFPRSLLINLLWKSLISIHNDWQIVFVVRATSNFERNFKPEEHFWRNTWWTKSQFGFPKPYQIVKRETIWNILCLQAFNLALKMGRRRPARQLTRSSTSVVAM